MVGGAGRAYYSLGRTTDFNATAADAQQMERITGIDVMREELASYYNARFISKCAMPLLLRCHSKRGRYHDAGGIYSGHNGSWINVYLRQDLPKVLR